MGTVRFGERPPRVEKPVRRPGPCRHGADAQGGAVPAEEGIEGRKPVRERIAEGHFRHAAEGYVRARQATGSLRRRGRLGPANRGVTSPSHRFFRRFLVARPTRACGRRINPPPGSAPAGARCRSILLTHTSGINIAQACMRCWLRSSRSYLATERISPCVFPRSSRCSLATCPRCEL